MAADRNGGLRRRGGIRVGPTGRTGAGGRLSPEDERLWRLVTRSLRPLGTRRPQSPAEEVPGEPSPAAAERPRGAAPAGERAEARGASAPARVLRPAGPSTPPAITLRRASAVVDEPGRGTPGLDARTAEALRRGLLDPEARLDLHGLTAERAHRALDRFVAGALARGLRLVLVITGKGGRRPGGPDAPFMRPEGGLLRHQVPRWLRTGPHAARIVGVFAAHRRHGGAGALYVYLKKRR